MWLNIMVLISNNIAEVINSMMIYIIPVSLKQEGAADVRRRLTLNSEINAGDILFSVRSPFSSRNMVIGPQKTQFDYKSPKINCGSDFRSDRGRNKTSLQLLQGSLLFLSRRNPSSNSICQ